MKNSAIALFILITQLTTTKAQNGAIKVPALGSVDIAELQLRDCSFSPGAAAVNLLKYKEILRW
jgi:hypothetical protein